jgi:hypothetical protein
MFYILAGAVGTFAAAAAIVHMPRTATVKHALA